MDEPTSISRKHIIARISNRLITSPILSKRRIPIDPAEKLGQTVKTWQMICVKLAKIWIESPFLPPLPAKAAAATISRSVLTARGMKTEQKRYNGHKTRPILGRQADAYH